MEMEVDGSSTSDQDLEKSVTKTETNNKSDSCAKNVQTKGEFIAKNVIVKDVSDILNPNKKKNVDVIEICDDDTSKPSANEKIDEIIDICDDDDDYDNCDPEEKLKRSKCVNINCKSGDDLEPCEAMFVFRYFGMKRAKDQLVCAQCFNMALKHQENLAGLLEQHIPLFEAKFPDNNAVVVLDSDEEDDGDDKEMLPEDVRLMIENDIDELLQKNLYEYDIDYQIQENLKITEKKIAELEVTRKELDEGLDNAMKVVDEFYKKIYENFDQPVKEIDPLIIAPSPPPSPLIQYPRLPPQKIQYGQMQNVRPTAVATKKVTQIRPVAQQHDQVSQDIVELYSDRIKAPPLPPIGQIERPKLEVGNSVYVMRVSFFTSWVRARVIEITHGKPPENSTSGLSDLVYKVKIESCRKSANVKILPGRYLAYPSPSPVRLPVGSRVIAIFKEEGQTSSKDNYYSGIIAEAPKISNKYRYLVFFDDGYAQYVPHDNILLVCESSRNVWEDVHPESQEFIKNYLSQYPERPMVKLNLDEVVRTEWNGKWWVARVKEIDGSLVKMYFDADERTEWIYRGSTRLGPLYVEMLAAKDRQESGGRHRHISIKRRNMPYVEYTRNADFEDKGDEDELVKASEVVPSRSVARKSTNRKPNSQDHLGPVDASEKPKEYIEQQHPGYFVKVSLADAIKPRFFRPHQCNESCVFWTRYNLVKAKGMNCLIRPLKFGFQRLFCNKRGKPLVTYLAPCGRRLRNHEEVHMYLRNTKSELTVDLFDFDPWVSCVVEYKLESDRTMASIKDLSYEKENVPISCVNYVDSSLPDFVYYMIERKAMDGVNLNLDPNFLSGCDCTDGCSDRTKCACWRLTVDGAKSIPGYSFDENTIGYQYRRLADRVVSGIYECNSQCKCSHTCLNRVAQQPLSVKLQLYKTLMKGWGIRCLHDIPQGSFICIYAGNLLTEQAANEGGKNYGDEYLAELDYIEVVENLKEDYESDVVDDYDENSKDRGREKNSDDSDDYNDEDDGEDDSYSANEFDGDGDSSQDSTNINSDKRKNRYENDDDYKSYASRNSSASDSSSIRTRLRTRGSDKDREKSRKNAENEKRNSSKDNVLCISDDDEEVRQPSRFAANLDDSDRGRNFKSVRDYYGEDECIYVMDAKNSGNIGRYLNHSCNPNIFVQNVFVDTHDLRFPWVAFFASHFIKAGDELTWDYNYDVGSVPGKVLHCYCGETSCRRRLL